MPRPPVRTGIERADYPEDGILYDTIRRSNLAILNSVDPSKYIPFRKKPVSNNTSIALAEQERQHRAAAASAAGQSTGISASKNILIKKGHVSNYTLTSSDQQGKQREDEASIAQGSAGISQSKNTLYKRDM